MSICIGCAGHPSEAGALKRAGFDYLEVNISQLVAACDSDVTIMQRQLCESELPVLAGNCFLPGNWPLGGAGFDEEKNRAYIEKAAARLQALGAKIAVLGSGGARRLQKEYGENRGKEQFLLFFAMASAIMGEKGIRVVIEPLSHNESNYILSVPEALEIAKAVDSPFGGILCDYYHMGQEGEPTTVLPAAKDRLWHCHIAHPITRQAPLPGDGGRYEELAAALKQCEYKGNITFEGICPDSEEVFAQSVGYLKTLFQGGAACR